MEPGRSNRGCRRDDREALGPSPISQDEVKGYIGVIRVSPATEDNATFVEWSSSWTGNDAAAEEFSHPIYVALLDALKKSLS